MWNNISYFIRNIFYVKDQNTIKINDYDIEKNDQTDYFNSDNGEKIHFNGLKEIIVHKIFGY